MGEGPRRRFALLGTITTDLIEGPAGPVSAGVGGILYQAAALCGLGGDVVLQAGMGEESRGAFEAAVRGWQGLDSSGVWSRPGPGNRVHLHYPLEGERWEVLESAVPPHDPAAVLAGAAGCEAMLCALNSGFDLTLEAWREIVAGFSGPIWLDIHSLALEPVLGRPRAYLPLPAWRDWARGAAWLQANRQEVACMLGRPLARPGAADLRRFAAEAMHLGARAVFVTLGSAGALVFTGGEEIGIEAPPSGEAKDTTGCGDVFAAGALLRIARGDDPAAAAAFGVDLASRAAGVSGVRETYELARTIAAGHRPA